MTTRSRAAALVRGLSALILLITMLAAVPYLLFRIGVLPHHLPTFAEAGHALTSPDSGQLFLGAITLLGWYGWLSFVISVLLEISASLRHRSAPRIRLLGGTQRLASTLVGAIMLLLPTSTAFAAVPPQAATTAVSAGVSATQAAPSAAGNDATASPDTYTGPVHHVKAGDSLWEIAEKRLDSGQRWHEIVEANKGIPQTDGSYITADTTVLQPGWTLRLPAGASHVDDEPHTQVPSSTSSQQRTHTVRPGESLSSIAEYDLGNAAAYPQIAKLNEGRAQPDGRTMQNPDEIYPGWNLVLPGPAHSAPAAPQAPHEQPSTPPPSHHDTTRPPAKPAPDQGNHQHTDKHHGAGNHEGGTSQAPTAPATGQPHTSPETSSPSTTHEPKLSPPSATTSSTTDNTSVRTMAAIGSLLAAGVLSVLASRRALQQRRRRIKQRIPMPNGPAVDFEKQLRVAGDPVTVDFLDRALRTLASRCASTGHELPDVEAARMTTKGVELYLATPTPPIPPFTDVDGVFSRWWCSAQSSSVLTEDEAADITAPYPMLVSIGSTAAEEPVLVNLEAIGLLQLEGNAEDVHSVLLAVAVELAASRLADDASVMLTGVGQELEALFPARVEHYSASADALADLCAHDAFQRNALKSAAAEHLRDARSRHGGGDAWTPKVLLSVATSSEEDTQALADLMLSRPRTSVAVVTDTALDAWAPGGWVLPTAGGTVVDLPGLDLTVELQRLDRASYTRLVDILSTADRTDDAPAPTWTLAPDGDSALGEDVLAPVPTAQPHAGDLPVEEETAENMTAEDLRTQPAAAQTPAAAPPVDLSTALPDFNTLAPAVSTMPEPTGGQDAEQVALDDLPTPLDEESRLSRATMQKQEEVREEAAAEREAAPTAAPVRIGSVSTVLATLHSDPVPRAHPQIRLLGPVDVIGAQGKVASDRRRRLIEIAAWFILHPGLGYESLDDAIFPGQRANISSRNSAVSRLRAWFGRDPAMDPRDPSSLYLPEAENMLYAFNRKVTSDWSVFQELYQAGMHRTGTEADTALAKALTLVRGRPFAGINPARYAWAEPDIQEMISAVVDVAYHLAERRRAIRDYRGAAVAVSKGLAAMPDSDQLYRVMFQICSESGDRAGLERAAAQLNRIHDELGTDPEQATIDVLRAALHGDLINHTA